MKLLFVIVKIAVMGYGMTKKIPIVRLWYCKADKSTGKPIIVQDVEKGITYNTNSIEYKNVTVRMAFNNAHGKAKSSGATTILEIYENE